MEISVLRFTDYRAFLTAHIQQMRRRNSLWSLGAWARHMGLRTTSSLSKIINGERNPGERITKQLIEYFSFDLEEELHFRNLIGVQKILTHPRFRSSMLESTVSADDFSYQRIDEATFSSLSEWYCYAIREMVNLPGFSEDPEWISEQLAFPVPPLEVKKAIQKLLKAGLLKRGKKGLEPSTPHINTRDDVASEAIQRFHEQSLENGKAALRNVDVESREITSTIFVIEPRDVPEAKAMIRKFRKRFARSLERAHGKQVYQLEIAFFPVTKNREAH